MNSIYILTILIFILTFILLKTLKIKKDFIICIFLTLFTILFFSNMDTALNGIKSGLSLCFNSIIPSIFSFSIICNLLISFNGIHIYSKILGKFLCTPFRLPTSCSFILIASFLCGYPLGAKYAGDAYLKKIISFSEYKRILNIASNASPIFILGVLGISLLGNLYYGYLILFSNFISILAMSLFIKPVPKQNFKTSIHLKKAPKFGMAFQEAIETSLKTTLTVCGYVISFSLVIALLKDITILENFFTSIENFLALPKGFLYGTFLGSIEITNGSSIIAHSNISLIFKISILSFFCCFSGFSIIFQTSSFFCSKKISLLKYSLLKLLQGFIGFITCFIISSLVLKNTAVSSLTTFNFSLSKYLFITLIFISFPFIFYKIKQMKH